MMKRILLGAVALLALGAVAPAVAADLPASTYTKAPQMMMPALYDWSGVYVGINGGWGTSNRCWDQTGTTVIGPDGCHTTSGGFAGAQAGYRWQTGSWVWGFEALGDWASLRGSSVSLLTPANTNRSRIDAFGLFTGQIGYAWNTALFYFKGGGAVVADRNDIISNGTLVATSAGAGLSVPASSSRSRRTGRRPSNTTTCSSPTPTRPSPTRSAVCPSVPIASAATPTSCRSASTIAGAARSSPNTEHHAFSNLIERPALAPAFLLAIALKRSTPSEGGNRFA
jgi:outer membrane immunogenic protein